MDSFAITYKLDPKLQAKDPNDKQVTADLHVNYWKLPRCIWGSSYTRFVDIGIMIHDYANYLNSIQVFIPFKIKQIQIKDLGGKIGSSTELLCSLFNEEFVCTNDQNAKSYYSVNTPPGSAHKPFFIYKLDIENFDVCEVGNGSLLNIKILTVPSNIKGLQEIKDKNTKEIPLANLYLRFRIENLKKNTFCSITSIQNDVLQKAFSKIEYLDFKVNRRRDIEGKVQEIINKEYVYLKYKKIHFFFGSSFKDGEIEGSLPLKDTRIIDISRWAKYFEDVKFNSNSVMTTHHWEAKAEGNELKERFDLFFKTKYSSDSFFKILWYIAIVIVLGAAGSLLANKIQPDETIQLREVGSCPALYDGRNLAAVQIVEFLTIAHNAHSMGLFGTVDKSYICGITSVSNYNKSEGLHNGNCPMAVLCKDPQTAKEVIKEMGKQGYMVIDMPNSSSYSVVFISIKQEDAKR